MVPGIGEVLLPSGFTRLPWWLFRCDRIRRRHGDRLKVRCSQVRMRGFMSLPHRNGYDLHQEVELAGPSLSLSAARCWWLLFMWSWALFSRFEWSPMGMSQTVSRIGRRPPSCISRFAWRSGQMETYELPSNNTVAIATRLTRRSLHPSIVASDRDSHAWIVRRRHLAGWIAGVLRLC